jgi:chromatin remodeling complex protein RSC6
MEDISAIHQLQDITATATATVKPFIVQTNLQMDQQRSNIEALFDSIQQNFAQIKTTIVDFQGQLRNLEKAVKTEVKNEIKNEVKNEIKKRDSLKPMPVALAPALAPINKIKPTKIMGFDVSEKITPELAAFMQLPSDQKATRNAVTQYITEYIRQNKLQDMTERKNINLNTDLTALFKLTLEKDQTQLTYFNLQKHINALFS